MRVPVTQHLGQRLEAVGAAARRGLIRQRILDPHPPASLKLCGTQLRHLRRHNDEGLGIDLMEGAAPVPRNSAGQGIHSRHIPVYPGESAPVGTPEASPRECGFGPKRPPELEARRSEGMLNCWRCCKSIAPCLYRGTAAAAELAAVTAAATDIEGTRREGLQPALLRAAHQSPVQEAPEATAPQLNARARIWPLAGRSSTGDAHSAPARINRRPIY